MGPAGRRPAAALGADGFRGAVVLEPGTCTGRFAQTLWNGERVPVPDVPSDTIESPGVPVTPASLYLSQLRERLGSAALANIGY